MTITKIYFLILMMENDTHFVKVNKTNPSLFVRILLDLNLFLQVKPFAIVIIYFFTSYSKELSSKLNQWVPFLLLFISKKKFSEALISLILPLLYFC